jgi:drug/metabolite transporter (DMT)-like permease
MTVLSEENNRLNGVIIALSTPLLLGMAPIFGKMAIAEGADPFSVAALRTAVSVLLLWVVYLLFFRRFITIYPAGLLGCVVVGVINGIGSIFYYGGLERLNNASLAQLLNGTYLIFAVFFSRMDGEKFTARVILRVTLAVVAMVLLTGFGITDAEPQRFWLGVGLMLANALMFAGTVFLSKYVLYEMPPQTVTLYVLTTMGILVGMVWIAVGTAPEGGVFFASLLPLILLGLTTVLSRLTMFTSIKFLGSMQTAVLAILEIGVALALAFVIHDERLTPGQLVGVGLLFASLLLIRREDLQVRRVSPLNLTNIYSIQFQGMAFKRAFGQDEPEDDPLGKISTAELRAIQRMMGLEDGPAVNPFPVRNDPTEPNIDPVSALRDVRARRLNGSGAKPAEAANEPDKLSENPLDVEKPSPQSGSSLA